MSTPGGAIRRVVPVTPTAVRIAEPTEGFDETFKQVGHVAR